MITLSVLTEKDTVRHDKTRQRSRLDAWLRGVEGGVALSVAVMILLIAGCGGSGGTPINSVNTDVGAPTARAQEKYAEAVNIHPTDVPMMTLISAEGETKASDFASAVTRCRGGLPGWEAMTIHSPRFEQTQKQEIVMSAIRVMPSAATAKRAIASDLSARFRTCIVHAFDTRPPNGPLVKKDTTVSRLTVPLPKNAAVSSSFGIEMDPKITYRSTISGRSNPPYDQGVSQDILGFALGRAEVILVDTHDPQAFPSPTERQLLSLLYDRAHEQSKGSA